METLFLGINCGLKELKNLVCKSIPCHLEFHEIKIFSSDRSILLTIKKFFELLLSISGDFDCPEVLH
ncbi:hypothetical protein BpHYR1_054092 [Brachionus plicatilis]|uniref:Uncharacterized protein n=1 Tax=Brachionus plicatilis TaxID=10195 RepID=A0A3M7RXA3_BRAPC|nr:hypothetical protein BpHYR1_054092 [Brachionus plicatilis]